jgi:hypothetical protein
VADHAATPVAVQAAEGTVVVVVVVVMMLTLRQAHW